MIETVSQLKEEIEVNGSDEELEEEDEAAEREGETSGSELERVEQDEVSHCFMTLPNFLWSVDLIHLTLDEHVRAVERRFVVECSETHRSMILGSSVL